MGTKRSISETDSGNKTSLETGPIDHFKSRRGGDDNGAGRPWKKPKFSKKSDSSIHKTHDVTASWTRKRARTIERRLQHPQALPANIRNDLERELASHRSTIDDASTKKQRSKMISKYHMVRFFERQKATRLLRQLRQELEKAKDPDEIPSLERDIHTAEVDVSYTLYFPHLERYVSLYPSASRTKADGGGSDCDEQGDKRASSTTAREALRLQRPKIWHDIEGAMLQGQRALERLRDRRFDMQQHPKIPSSTTNPHVSRESHRGSGGEGSHNEKGNARENEADDDFFE
jgi:hypothetical protein